MVISECNQVDSGKKNEKDIQRSNHPTEQTSLLAMDGNEANNNATSSRIPSGIAVVTLCSILAVCWAALFVQDNNVKNGPSAASAALASRVTIDASVDDWAAAVERHVFLEPLQRRFASNSHLPLSSWQKQSDRVWWNSAVAYARTGLHKHQKDSSSNDTTWWQSLETWLDEHDHHDKDSHTLVYLNHSEAYHWLSPPTAHPHVFLVHPDVQRNQAYCGVATTLATVNSFHFPAMHKNDDDEDPVYAPYAYLTDHSLLQSSCVQETVLAVTATHNPILEPPYGLSLQQVAGLLDCVPTVQVEQVVYVVEDNETIMDPLIHALQDPHLRVLINFHRGLAGQVGGGGHFSPVIAYHHEGFVLVADVAKYKYPYVWIPLATLRKSMAGLDACGKRKNNHTMTMTMPPSPHEMATMLKELGCEPTPRGYIVVSAKEHRR